MENKSICLLVGLVWVLPDMVGDELLGLKHVPCPSRSEW